MHAPIGCTRIYVYRYRCMAWLRLVGSLKLHVSYAEYRLFYWALLQKRPVILWSLLIVASPYMTRGAMPTTASGNHTLTFFLQTLPIYVYTHITHTYTCMSRRTQKERCYADDGERPKHIIACVIYFNTNKCIGVHMLICLGVLQKQVLCRRRRAAETHGFRVSCTLMQINVQAYTTEKCYVDNGERPKHSDMFVWTLLICMHQQVVRAYTYTNIAAWRGYDQQAP